MRLSWLFPSQLGSFRAPRRRCPRKTVASLRVRLLERRRVLDAAMQSLIITPTVSTTEPGSTGSQDAPLDFDWSAAQQTSEAAPSGSAALIDAETPNAYTTETPAGGHFAAAGNVDDNVRPVLVVAIDQTVDEGSELDLSGIGGAPPLGLFIDTDTTDSHTATVNWGDGSTTENAEIFAANGSGSLGGRHTYANEGVFTVTVSVSDQSGGSDTQSFQVTVSNVRPVLVVAVDQTVDEGQPLNLSGTGGAPPVGLFIDSGILDTHTATVNWGDGSATENATIFPAGGSGALGGMHTYTDNGDYTVTVSVVDNFGDSDTETFTVRVRNVAPTATLSNSGPISEGDSADVMFSNQMDPSSADTAAGFRYAYDFNNDGTFEIGDGTYAGSSPNAEQAVPEAHLEDGPDLVSVRGRILDKDGGFTDYITQIDVGNARPALANVAGDTIDEGEVATIGARIVDPGPRDEFEVFVDWRDGTTANITGLGSSDSSGTVGGTDYEWMAATRELRLSHRYLDDDPTDTLSDTYGVLIAVRDDDGSSSTAYEAPVVVNNVRPVLVVAIDQTVDEMENLDLSGEGAPPIGLFIDVGILDTHEATIDWGDGTAIEFATVFPAGGSGALGGQHMYADEGQYIVTITISDDDGGSETQSFTVTVLNVPPVLVVAVDQTVDEGTELDLSGENVPPLGLFIDPGKLDIHEATIDWGDGFPSESGSILFANGSGVVGGKHTYADDGVYTVTVTVSDGDGGSDTQSFLVTVNNVAPTLRNIVPSLTRINESDGISFTAEFTDPGFDNERNPNPPTEGIADPLHESFSYEIDWGDGHNSGSPISVADVDGGVGRPSSGSFGGSHTYADDGRYKVTLTITDDNGGKHCKVFYVTVDNMDPSFVTAPGGASFVGDDVSPEGITTIRVSFSDPGYDNPDNPNAAVSPDITDPLHESFTHILDWGDGTIDAIHTYPDAGLYTVEVEMIGPGGTANFTFAGFNSASSILTLVSGQALFDPAVPAQLFTYNISWGDGVIQKVELMLKAPGIPLASNGLTSIVFSQRTPGNEGTLTQGSFVAQHRYLGPPDPANASADIPITVTVMDDNNGSVSDTILVSPPILETPKPPAPPISALPQLTVLQAAPTQIFIDGQTSTTIFLQTTETRLPRSELLITTDLYLELEVVAPDGEVISTHRIEDEALFDLRKFFRTLPDGHYRIYLVREENRTRRLIIEVFVRRGRVIEPGDDTEGTRDRPPTSEETVEAAAQPPQGDADRQPAQGAAGSGDADQPAENAGNPQAGETHQPAEGPAAAGDQSGRFRFEFADREPTDASHQPLTPSATSLRWTLPLAGLVMAATRGRGNWSTQIDEALEQAGSRDWQRLHRAGRLGRFMRTQ